MTDESKEHAPGCLTPGVGCETGCIVRGTSKAPPDCTCSDPPITTGFVSDHSHACAWTKWAGRRAGSAQQEEPYCDVCGASGKDLRTAVEVCRDCYDIARDPIPLRPSAAPSGGAFSREDLLALHLDMAEKRVAELEAAGLNKRPDVTEATVCEELHEHYGRRIEELERAIADALQSAVEDDIIGADAFAILQAVMHDGIPAGPCASVPADVVTTMVAKRDVKVGRLVTSDDVKPARAAEHGFAKGDAVRVVAGHEHAGLTGTVVGATEFIVTVLDAEGDTSPWHPSSLEKQPRTSDDQTRGPK